MGAVGSSLFCMKNIGNLVDRTAVMAEKAEM